MGVAVYCCFKGAALQYKQNERKKHVLLGPVSPAGELASLIEKEALN